MSKHPSKITPGRDRENGGKAGELTRVGNGTRPLRDEAPLPMPKSSEQLVGHWR
ncbi:MAG: hypothetical protein SW833_17970 [Cyanobacteriota bacterium]|nr:hypothetical protein [Cyanobacteriota bacterium]